MASVQEVINMEVVGKKGTKFGHVKDVEINMHDLTVEGLVLRGTIFNDEMYVWKNYVDGIESGKILLTFDLDTLESREVYDKNDKKLGTISSVDGKGKKTVFTVHMPDAKPSGRMGLAKPELLIPVHEILAMGPHIIVDITKSRAEKYVNQERAEI